MTLLSPAGPWNLMLLMRLIFTWPALATSGNKVKYEESGGFFWLQTAGYRLTVCIIHEEENGRQAKEYRNSQPVYRWECKYYV